MTVNFVELVPVPPGVVTAIVPVTAPLGTSASISVSLITSWLLAATPPNVTSVAPVKLFPLIVTEVPTGPLVGVKLLTSGTTANAVVLLAVPPRVVTMIFSPVFAPAGTVALTCVSDSTVNAAALPPIDHAANVCLRLTPVIVTVLPTCPLDGLKLVNCGVTRNA